MSGRVDLISGSIGAGFDAALAAAIAAGGVASGDPFSDGANTYQYVVTTVNDLYNFNPDLLSVNFRNQMGIINTIPSSSALTLEEFYTLYKHT